jgi:hypothetical protein
MKRTLVRFGLLLLLSAALVPVQAYGQPSIIALYFDRDLTQRVIDCPDSTPVVDTLYVGISGFTEPIEGIEYRVIFPDEIAYIGYVELGRGLKLGNPIEGLSMAFFTPQDASSPVLIQEIMVVWLCEGCVTSHDMLITLAAHPVTGSLRAVTSDLAFEDVIGFTSVVCPWYVEGEHEIAATQSRPVYTIPAAEQCVLDCPAGDGGVIIPGTLPGQHHSPDLDDNGEVDIVDFALFAMHYDPVPIFDPDRDYYCSGNLDLLDFVLFTRHWEHSEDIPVRQSTWGNVKALYSE